MYINRAISKSIVERLKVSNKIVLLYGARQVGKTTLAKQITKELGLKILSINADQTKYIDILSSRDADKLRALVSGYEILFLDEAQRIPDIGINLKILADEIPHLKMIVTGSSSFELANKVTEHLTGRVWTYTLYPVSIYELSNMYNEYETNNQLENLLIYGSYPEVYTTLSFVQKIDLLEEITRSYLYKDVLELATIKHSSKIKDLLKLLSFQIGNEVSISELSTMLNLSRDAVNHYIDLLEKSFVIFRLKGFSRNLRKEVTKMDKIYFYDLGIRNALIDNFKMPKDRDDVGRLWENFLIIERQKLLSYMNIHATSYFWRTHTGAELDYLEERDGKLFGYEFKYGKTAANAPKTWLDTYKNSSFNLINKENYLQFLKTKNSG